MKRDLEFLYEVGAFRFFNRSWTQFLGTDFANHAEHSFRVAWTALIIAANEGKKVDTDKILKMALVHDLSEGRTGDPNYLSRQYMERNENLAFSDIFKDTVMEKEMLALVNEYRERKSLESKIVKDADQIDVDFELKEQEVRGNKLRTMWGGHRKSHVYPQLFTKTAQEIFKKIQTSNPHDWHINGRNRVTGGDWKKFGKKQGRKTKK